MTPATLRKLEWAGSVECGTDYCPVCENLRSHGSHAPDCELDAAIKQAEQAEKGERPEIRVGDVVALAMWSGTSDYLQRVQEWNMDLLRARTEEIEALYRDPLWRQEPPTHD